MLRGEVRRRGVARAHMRAQSEAEGSGVCAFSRARREGGSKVEADLERSVERSRLLRYIQSAALLKVLPPSRLESAPALLVEN